MSNIIINITIRHYRLPDNASNSKNTERKPHDNLSQTKQYSKKIYGYLAIVGSHTQIIYEWCLHVILDKFVG